MQNTKEKMSVISQNWSILGQNWGKNVKNWQKVNVIVIFIHNKGKNLINEYFIL